MIHKCDYCFVRREGVGPLLPSPDGSTFEPHDAVRVESYPKTDDLSRISYKAWPGEPPYCATCGHELLTLADVRLDGTDLESHAVLDLNP